MSSYELKIAELNKRSADISAQLISLDDQYKELVIEAAEGNSRVPGFLMMPSEILACWLCLGDWR
jgi:hypothetical protein